MMDLSTIREIIAEDIEFAQHERAGGSNARSAHSLEDYTLHDMVRVAQAACEAGHSVELTACEGGSGVCASGLEKQYASSSRSFIASSA